MCLWAAVTLWFLPFSFLKIICFSRNAICSLILLQNTACIMFYQYHKKTENFCIWNESKLLHLPGPVTIQGERWKYADVLYAWKCITFSCRPASTIKFSFNSDNCSVSLCLPGWKGTTCYVFQDQFAILNLQLSNTDVDIFWHTAKANT